jgi:hypothetical protein
MDPFAAIMLGIVVFVVGALIALGLWYPGSGAAQVGWRSPKEHAEREAALDEEDLEQLLEAANARRRARGDDELTVDRLVAEQQAAALAAIDARRAAKAREREAQAGAAARRSSDA